MRLRAGEGLLAQDPLFTGRKGGRLTTRHLRRLLKVWLAEAGLDESLHFHELRHTAVTSFYSRSKDVVLAQAFARHRDLRTTQVYLHASEQAMAEAIAGQLC